MMLRTKCDQCARINKMRKDAVKDLNLAEVEILELRRRIDELEAKEEKESVEELS